MKRNLVNLLSGMFVWGLFASPIQDNTLKKEKNYGIDDLTNSEIFSTACSKVNKIKKLSDSIRYGEEYFQNTTETEYFGTGDCDDRTTYFARDLIKAGFDVSIFVGISDTTKSSSINHMWIEYQNHVLDPNFLKTCNGDTTYYVRIFDKKDLEPRFYQKRTPPRRYKKKFKKAQKNEEIKLKLN